MCTYRLKVNNIVAATNSNRSGFFEFILIVLNTDSGMVLVTTRPLQGLSRETVIFTRVFIWERFLLSQGNVV